MLDLYVSERVEELTRGEQTPTTLKPPNVPDFPPGRPGKIKMTSRHARAVWCHSRSLSSLLMIFPEMVLGSSFTYSMILGYL